MYHHAAKLFGKLKMSKASGTCIKGLGKMERQLRLILDDFGIQPFDAQNRARLMDIIEDRQGMKSTIITSLVQVAK